MATGKKTKSSSARSKSAKRKSAIRRKPARAAAKAPRRKQAPKRARAQAVAPVKKSAAPAPAKPATASARPAAAPAPAAPQPAPAAPQAAEERVGVVTHFYSHLSVAVVRLESGSLRLGDTIHVKGHTSDFRQRVESMQIEHQPVTEVGPGQEFGLKVIEHAREHDVVYKVGR